MPDVILEEKPKTFPSCKAFLESDPTAQSGIYYITPDPAGSPVKVYCDMTTDGGGWTMLLASGLSGPEFGPTGAFWNGTSNSTKTYRYDCRDYKASDMEALIRSLAFDEIKFNHYGQNIYSSTTNSTFVAKKSATTPWINKSGNIGTLAWNGSDPSYG